MKYSQKWYRIIFEFNKIDGIFFVKISLKFVIYIHISLILRNRRTDGLFSSYNYLPTSSTFQSWILFDVIYIELTAFADYMPSIKNQIYIFVDTT